MVVSSRSFALGELAMTSINIYMLSKLLGVSTPL